MVGSMLAQGVYFAYKAGSDLDYATVGRAGNNAGYRTRRGLYATKATNIARIQWDDLDGDGVTERPRLLMEGSTTNQITDSEAIDVWNLSNASVNVNAVLAPDGALTADELIENGSAAVAHQAWETPNTAAGDNESVAASVFAKANTRTWLRISVRQRNGSEPGAWFNLATGTLGSKNVNLDRYAIEPYNDGWYRCSVEDDVGTGADAAAGRIICGLATGDNVTTYNGDGSSSLYLWGGQVEINRTYISSYVRSSGGVAVRNADQIDFPAVVPLHKSWSLYCRCELLHGRSAKVDNFRDLIGLLDGDSSERLLLYRDQANPEIEIGWRQPIAGTAVRAWTPPAGHTFEILARHDASDHHLDLALDGSAFSSGAIPTQVKPFSQPVTTVRLRNDGDWKIEIVKVLAGLHNWSSTRSAPTPVGV